MKSIRDLVCEILREDAYKKKTGSRYTGDIDMFKNSVNKDGYYLHFSDVPKVGINPKSNFLPGIYLYPNIKPIYDAFFADPKGWHRGQARAARYVYLVKINPGLKIVEGKSEIFESSQATMKKIIEPLINANLSDWIVKNDEDKEKLKNIVKQQALGFSYADPSHRYPNLKELEEMGLLSLILEKQKSFKDKVDELNKIKSELASKSVKNMSKDELRNFLRQKLERLNVLLDNSLGGGMFSPKYERELRDNTADLETALTVISKSLTKQLKELVNPFIVGPTFEKSLETFHYHPHNTVHERRSGGLSTIGPILRDSATLPMLATLLVANAGKLSYKLINLLGNMKRSNDKLLTKNNTFVSKSDIANKCFEAAKEVLGEQMYQKLVKAISQKDEVGINTIVAIGNSDGVNDISDFDSDVYEKLKSGEGGYAKHSLLSGTAGVLGRYESAQLFLKAPISNKISIISMVDRFEGSPSDYLPGTHTPDTLGDEDDSNYSRLNALKSRFSKKSKSGEVTRTERWKEK